ncbi:MAG: hypothetical protein DI527_18215 [Chelatococcus sp.]|nr:MAG: hypothetical protein DI527_18215 [Chelatococcus sp.]
MSDVSQQWFYAALGAKVGPISRDDLIAELGKRLDGRDVLVWRQGLADWTRAGNLPELTLAPPPLPVQKTVAPKRTSPWKVAAWIVSTPILLFVAFAILLAISEAFSDTETYASSVGMSVSQCRDVRMAFGERYERADVACSARQPKRKP